MKQILHAFAYINQRNYEALAHIAMWTHASVFYRFMDTNLYRTCSIKIWKTRHRISMDIWIYLLQCTQIWYDL